MSVCSGTPFKSTRCATHPRCELATVLCIEPSPHTRTLPPELWHRVFSLLLYIPGALSISDASAIEAFSEDSEGIILHDLYHETMSAKLAISRVSWMWRRLVLPFLFEYVIIRSGQHARTFGISLSQFKTEQAEEEYYGQWVKRVEVAMEDHYWEQETIDSLASILEKTPNIIVYSDYFSSPRFDATVGIINRLHFLCEERHLRRIEWSGTLSSSLSDLLRGTPSLEVLMLRQLPRHPSSLPNLNILIVGHGRPTHGFELRNIDAPNLRSLIMHSNALDTSCHGATMHVHGLFSMLQRLRCVYTFSNEPALSIGVFKRLTVLTLDFGRRLGGVERLEKNRIRYKSLERLNVAHLPALRPQFYHSCDMEEWRTVSAFMLSFLNTENNPSLKSVGFFIPQTYFDHASDAVSEGAPVPYEDFWRDFTTKCCIRGIKIEASLGSDAHFWNSWQPFHTGLLPRTRIRNL